MLISSSLRRVATLPAPPSFSQRYSPGNRHRAAQPIQRRMPVVRAVYDPVVYNAANEVWSALGAMAIASASLYGLARIIREANFGPEDMHRQQELQASHEAAAAAAVAAEGAPAANAAQPAAAVESLEPVNVPSTATTRVTEPFVAAKQKEALPGKMTTDVLVDVEEVVTVLVAEEASPDAAAIIEELTSDAPVGITASAAGGGPAGDAEPAPAVLAGKMTADTAAAEAISPEEAYQARLDKILKDSTLAYNKTRRAQQQSAPVARESSGLRQRVAALSQSYQEKVDSLWQSYEQRKAQEQAQVQRGEKILLDLDVLEGAGKAEAQLSPVHSWWQRLAAFFTSIWAWLARIASQLFGGGSSGGGPAAASA